MSAMCAWHSVLPEQIGIEPVCGGFVLACGPDAHKAAGQRCQTGNCPAIWAAAVGEEYTNHLLFSPFLLWHQNIYIYFLYLAAHKTQWFKFQWLRRVFFIPPLVVRP